MANPNFSEFPLPVELLIDIIKHLSLKDIKRVSLVSQFTRNVAVGFIFKHLRYIENTNRNVRYIHRARNNVKEAIRKLEVYILDTNASNTDIFRFLETLPNLRSLECLVLPGELLWLFGSIRHAPLVELILDTGYYSTLEFKSRPTAGPCGLERLSIMWNVNDNPDEPGSALAHLHTLIRPSLTTLVELRIDNSPQEIFTDVDLQQLSTAGNTLRIFEYTLPTYNEGILDSIPEIFPHLTKLTIIWKIPVVWSPISNPEHSVKWKNTHIKALSKNINLAELTLSSDFEKDANASLSIRHDRPNTNWHLGCYRRRLKATQDLAMACPRLRRCGWVVMSISPSRRTMVHPFLVDGQLPGQTAPVVRGIKQDWMVNTDFNFDLADPPHPIDVTSWAYRDTWAAFQAKQLRSTRSLIEENDDDD